MKGTRRSPETQLLLVLVLAPLGIGTLSVSGLTGALEPVVWLGCALVAGFFLARTTMRGTLLIGIIAGVGWALANGMMQAVFFETYLENNPVYAAEYRQVTFMNPRYMGMLASPMPGLLTGLVIYLTAATVRRWRRLPHGRPGS